MVRIEEDECFSTASAQGEEYREEEKEFSCERQNKILCMGCSRSSLIGLIGLTDPGIGVVLLVLTARRLFSVLFSIVRPTEGCR